MLCGWISPEGEYYNCDYMDHYNLADEFCNARGYSVIIKDRPMPVDEVLVHNGWIKCYYSIFDRQHVRVYGPTRINEAQKKILREDYFNHPENWDKCEKYLLEELDVIDPVYDESGCRV